MHIQQELVCPAWHPSLHNQPFVRDGALQRRRRTVPQAELPSCLASSSDALLSSTDGWTTLHNLTAANNRASLGLYLRKRRSNFDVDCVAVDSHQRTPMHLACIADHFHIASTLLHHTPCTSTIEERDARDRDELQSLCLALENDAWWTLQELVVWKASEKVGNGSITGRRVGVKVDLLPQSWVDALLAYRWSFTAAVAGDCATAPGTAAATGRLRWPDYLTRNTTNDVVNLTLLHVAVAEPTLHRLAIYLCRCCTALCGVPTPFGCVPMHIGAQTASPDGGTEILGALLRGDESGQACVSANTSDHSTLPVHVLARYSYDGEEVVAWLSKTVYTLRHDQHITGVVDKRGWTVLHHACWAMAQDGDIRHFPKIKQVVRAWGASLDILSEGGATGEEAKITPRELVERSAHAATLLPLLDSLDDFCESYDF